MATLYDAVGPLDWCEQCGRLLTMMRADETCNREYCPVRESAEEDRDAMQRKLHDPDNNKGTDAGWH